MIIFSKIVSIFLTLKNRPMQLTLMIKSFCQIYILNVGKFSNFSTGFSHLPVSDLASSDSDSDGLEHLAAIAAPIAQIPFTLLRKNVQMSRVSDKSSILNLFLLS